MYSGGNASSLPLISGSPEPTIKELSSKGRKAYNFPKLDVPEKKIQIEGLREDLPNLPEVSEHDLVMHFTRLAHRNFAVDLGFYPLGSCTMKYNPRFADYISSITAFSDSHPATPDYLTQGNLEVLHKTELILLEITGMDHVTFQPPAGASGELTGLLMIKAYHKDQGNESKTKIIVPDSAHGTNPASASMAGYDVVEVPTNSKGTVDISELEKIVDESVAGLMLTNPNTVGLFETDILKIAEIIHKVDGLLYYDGANLNAMIGLCYPGKFGGDVSHLNLHKTFCIPHGGGGPGVGPIGVADHLKDFLPGNHSEDSSVGPISATEWGSASILPISWMYIRMMGSSGLKKATESAILNANYVAYRLKNHYEVLYKGDNGLVAHECIIDVRNLKESSGIDVEDIAKRLIDYGFHAPTCLLYTSPSPRDRG